LPREELAAGDVHHFVAQYGFSFPLLVRTPGYHGGDHFLKVDCCEELPDALTKLPGRELMVIEYLDARGVDGKSRKYRVMMIDGQLYPLHAAISSDWKIHYATAEMSDYPEHRAEDAEFLKNMAEVLGPTAMAALQEIQNSLGLDYGGIDFGLNAQRQVLLFEANATMAVVPPGAGPRWEYRRPAVDTVYRAARKMLIDRACPQRALA
jgi:glutathione synthase/RimK-type ligase-like ATP-grasp enzyme